MAKGTGGHTGRAWVFTINNPRQSDVDAVDKALAAAKYGTYGHEIGASGTPHLQGYVLYATPRKRSTLVNAIGGHAWVELRKGSHEEAAAYCQKDGDWVQYGEPPEPGKRNDLQAIREEVERGGGMRKVAETASSYQALKGAEVLLKHMEPKRDWVPEVRWYWGPTGTGKTRDAFAESDPAERWVSAESLQWWEGYDGHTDVILDDFRGDFCPFHTLLRYLDRYECRVMVKGGSRQLLARRIWITSCDPPERVYRNCSERVDQLLRRVTVVRRYPVAVATEVQGNNQGGLLEGPPEAGLPVALPPVPGPT